MSRRVALAVLSAVVISCSAFAGSVAEAAQAASCTKVRAEARQGTPEDVAFLFITNGVLRVNPPCAYDLVTQKLRKRTSRASFAAGTAVAVYKTRKPKAVTAELTPRVRLADQVGSWITLDAPDGKPRTFEIVLLKRDGRWLVDYWARAVGFN